MGCTSKLANCGGTGLLVMHDVDTGEDRSFFCTCQRGRQLRAERVTRVAPPVKMGSMLRQFAAETGAQVKVRES